MTFKYLSQAIYEAAILILSNPNHFPIDENKCSHSYLSDKSGRFYPHLVNYEPPKCTSLNINGGTYELLEYQQCVICQKLLKK